MTDPRPARDDRSLAQYLPFACLVALFYGLAVLARGPDLDEYWSLLYTRPSTPWREAWGWWSADTGHPAGYYLLGRIYHALAPSSVLAGRLANGLPLAMFAAALAWPGAAPAQRLFRLVFGIVVLANLTIVERFADMREYFSALMTLSVMVVACGRLLAAPASRRLKVLFWVLCLALPALNYMSFMAANALLVSTALVLCMQGRKADIPLLALPLVAGWVVLGSSLWNAARYPVVPFPYQVNVLQFAANLATVGGSALLGNVVVTLLASGSALRGWRGGLPWRHDPGWLANWALPLMLALAVLSAILGYTLINTVTHVMIKRQLFPLAVLVSAFVAAVYCMDRSRIAKPRLMLACMLATLAANVAFLWHTPNFRLFARDLAEAQRQCPAFRIHALNIEEDPRGFPTQNREHADAALKLGYASTARDYGFVLSDHRRVHGFDRHCGGAVWFEQFWTSSVPEVAPLLRRYTIELTAEQQAGIRIRQENSSLLIMIPGNAAPTAD